MNDIFRSEWRRFHRLAWIVAGLHLLSLVFLQRMDNLLQRDSFSSVPLFGIYVLVGLALALAQLGGYRKPSQWLWLMHRPLQPRSIFAALAGAATALLGVAILLPHLLLVIGIELFTTHVVDLRHYQMPLLNFAFVVMAWLAGSHAVLSRHKAAIALLPVPALMALSQASVWWLWIPVGICFAWLTVVALHGFRADRDAPLPGGASLFLTALPLQLGFFLLLFGSWQFLSATIGILIGTDPLNTKYPPRGGLIEVERAQPATVLVLGLQTSRDPRAQAWREQLPLLEPVNLGAYLQRFPLRQQFGNFQVSTQWHDEKHAAFWTFSHDAMRFHGRDPRSGEDRGWWGVKGYEDHGRFDTVPIVADGDLILTRSTLSAIDFDARRQHLWLRLPDGESFLSLPQRGFGRTFLLTDRRLIALRNDREAESKFAPPLIEWEAPLPAGRERLASVDLAEMMDGWLVSFVYGDGHRQIGFSQYNTVAEPFQHVVFVDPDGRSRNVAQRSIRRDYPAVQQVPWWISPPLHVLSEFPVRTLDIGLTWPLSRQWIPRDTMMGIFAAGSLALSLLLAGWWMRNSRIPAGRRRFWWASCALIGLPASLSLMCLEPRAPRA